MTFAELDRARQDAVIDTWLADYGDVMYHLWSSPEYPNTRTMTALLDHLQRRQLPPIPVLKTVIGWVLFEMQWRAKFRPLTPDELTVREAAERLSDSLYGPVPV
jgi:hypothetical protein